MESGTVDYLATISEHSKGLAAAAADNLEAAVAGCPGWSVKDLVAHVIEVHWFWSTIAEERLQDPPDDSRKPPRPTPDALTETLLGGAERMVRILRAADWQDPVWTWAPGQRNIGFIARHQVQEAAIHHWDAVRARGGLLEIGPATATDSIDEFLTFSVSSDSDPAEPPRPALDGGFALKCSDRPEVWTVTDGRQPGTVQVIDGEGSHYPVLIARASDLLLWLYQRIELDLGTVPLDLAERFRALCFTT